MRILFVGTPDFAVPSLKALVAAGHDIPVVLTQPDRPAGRGRRIVGGPVKESARAMGIEIMQPETLKSASVMADIERLGPEVIVVVAYGMLLKRKLLDLPEHGCINVHASLLPRWRGAAPIHRAIEAGDSRRARCQSERLHRASRGRGPGHGSDPGPAFYSYRSPRHHGKPPRSPGPDRCGVACGNP